MIKPRPSLICNTIIIAMLCDKFIIRISRVAQLRFIYQRRVLKKKIRPSPFFVGTNAKKKKIIIINKITKISAFLLRNQNQTFASFGCQSYIHCLTLNYFYNKNEQQQANFGRVCMLISVKKKKINPHLNPPD